MTLLSEWEETLDQLSEARKRRYLRKIEQGEWETIDDLLLLAVLADYRPVLDAWLEADKISDAYELAMSMQPEIEDAFCAEG
jgi:hypothetical protein